MCPPDIAFLRRKTFVHVFILVLFERFDAKVRSVKMVESDTPARAIPTDSPPSSHCVKSWVEQIGYQTLALKF